MARPHPTLTEAIHSPEFLAILPKLAAYAARLLRRAGWGEGRDHLPSAKTVGDVVQDAVLTCCEGLRVWPENVEFEIFLCGVMRSQVSHERRDAVRADLAYLDDLDDPPAPSSRRDQKHDARRLVAAVERTLSANPETRALFAAIADGNEKLAERAGALGWPLERASAARVKMNKMLAAAGLPEGDEDEEPRSHRSTSPSTAPPGGSRKRSAG